MTMSALVDFASMLPSTHQGALPTCVSGDVQRLLQCRLQGIPFHKMDSEKFEPKAMQESCADFLSRLIPGMCQTDFLFIPCDGNTIKPGSYFLSMPTTEGRSALVVFPPGDESIKDIQHMIGDDDIEIEEMNVKQLRRVLLVDGGLGCQLFSQPYSK
mmetsp:Transcript_12050/g.27894  ORF Transcript_12050/g.27894 Transcript_12050/m.27894 type:complete len:157 (+) Transcript_12050:924-1394(+)|eukprot:CAMPEP_0116839788 /NCGR_PEP_ID=MMETSP0418-20121206/9966_1 /TAXON_ID=1158023 /ORGANISM="Astrosyne radiata, Strain 13vi08-1A" /LENGTH=156 /DNA_ID=CAMNT_0004469947 /DNA_START=462 /DNA_END=932 /DNA_ORIENTATION=+